MRHERQDLEKKRKHNLAVSMGSVTAASLFLGFHLGAVYCRMEQPDLLEALAELGGHIISHPFELFPTHWLMAGAFLLAGVLADLYLYNEYLRVSGTVADAHGDAAFETDLRQYSREFVWNPGKVASVTGGKVTDRMAPYNGEYKRVLTRYPGRRVRDACLPIDLHFDITA